MATTTKNVGRITQVIGSTFDAEFDEDKLPAIYNAVKVESDNKGMQVNLTGEVQLDARLHPARLAMLAHDCVSWHRGRRARPPYPSHAIEFY